MSRLIFRFNETGTIRLINLIILHPLAAWHAFPIQPGYWLSNHAWNINTFHKLYCQF